MSKEEVLNIKPFIEEWASKPFKSAYNPLSQPQARPIRRLSNPVKGDKIRQIMETGEPLIVTMPSSAAFSLDRFCTLYGHQKCRIERCGTPAKFVRTGTLKSFFEREWNRRGFKVKVTRSFLRLIQLFECSLRIGRLTRTSKTHVRSW